MYACIFDNFSVCFTDGALCDFMTLFPEVILLFSLWILVSRMLLIWCVCWFWPAFLCRDIVMHPETGQRFGIHTF
jgi:hypothetical protein